ncbi:MAG: phytase [Fibrobacter sp.]|nr:phytase [Fibrobacter sp.]
MSLTSRLILLVFIFFPLFTVSAQISIPKKFTTASTGNDVDDCAIWVNPSDPEKSLVFVNDKGPAVEYGGLYAYTLDGTLLQKTLFHRPQNPDIRYSVVFGDDTIDVLVCVDRESGNNTYNKIRIFKINPSYAETLDGVLTEITTSDGILTGQNEAYGHGLYLRPSDGALFSIVAGCSQTDFTQIRLESDGAGKVKGTIVRKWGGSDIKGDLCEGICCDDELGYIYISDENYQILKYYADPDKNENTLISAFAKDDGIVADREGINIYRCDDNNGYILLSNQGKNEIIVYDRVTNEFIGSVIPDGMMDCDGLDVTAIPLGSQFPHGMAAFHLGTASGSQFGFYDWSDIASGLNLSTPCDAKRPGSGNSAITKRHKCTKIAGKRPVLQFDNQGIHLKNASFPDLSITISIFNVQGKKIHSQHISNQINGEAIITVPCHIVHSGIYMVKCNAGNNTLFTGMLTIE